MYIVINKCKWNYTFGQCKYHYVGKGDWHNRRYLELK